MRSFKQYLAEATGDRPVGFSWEAKPERGDPAGVPRTRTIVRHIDLRGEPAVILSDRQIIKVADLDKEIAWDAKALASYLRMHAKSNAAADAAAAEQASWDDIKGFETKIRTARGRARALTVLNKGRMVKREFAPLKKHIERLVAAGAEVTEHPGSKFPRRLTLPSGSFFAQKDLTKIGLDYAEYLLNR
jgi:hypothetical protein